MPERQKPVLISEFPVPCAQFIAHIKDTADEVWSHFLMLRHGREKHTPDQWRAILKQLSDEKIPA